MWILIHGVRMWILIHEGTFKEERGFLSTRKMIFYHTTRVNNKQIWRQAFYSRNKYVRYEEKQPPLANNNNRKKKATKLTKSADEVKSKAVLSTASE